MSCKSAHPVLSLKNQKTEPENNMHAGTKPTSALNNVVFMHTVLVGSGGLQPPKFIFCPKIPAGPFLCIDTPPCGVLWWQVVPSANESGSGGWYLRIKMPMISVSVSCCLSA